MKRSLSKRMAKKNKIHVPLRKCISCGDIKPKKELIRLFLDKSGILKIDDKKISGGRGAYICDSEKCKKKLLKHQKLQRVFRTKYPVIILNQTTGKQDQSFGGVNG